MRAYVEAVLRNLDGGTQGPLFSELISSLDRSYRGIIDRPPKGQLIFARFLLICHKSLLSAAALIAQRQPEDSVAVSRRAVECARVALAIKLNDANVQGWLSYQERHDRWLRWRSGEKPQALHVSFTELKGDPLADELGRWLGILSDAAVHFTPEFYNSLDWEERIEPGVEGRILLNYFHNDDREIERSAITLAAVHGTILKVFDRCFDGGISNDKDKLASVNNFWATAKKFSDQYCLRYGTAANSSPLPLSNPPWAARVFGALALEVCALPVPLRGFALQDL